MCRMNDIGIPRTVTVVVVAHLEIVKIKRYHHIIFNILFIIYKVVIGISVVKSCHGIIQCKLFEFLYPAPFFQAGDSLSCGL